MYDLMMTELVYKSFHGGDVKIIIPAAVKIDTVKIISNHRYLISIYTHPVTTLKNHH